MVCVLDDLHWGEETLLDLVEHIASLSRDALILVLCMARPELLERRAGWGAGQGNATTVVLEPLDEAETSELLDSLGGIERSCGSGSSTPPRGTRSTSRRLSRSCASPGRPRSPCLRPSRRFLPPGSISSTRQSEACSSGQPSKGASSIAARCRPCSTTGCSSRPPSCRSYEKTSCEPSRRAFPVTRPTASATSCFATPRTTRCPRRSGQSCTSASRRGARSTARTSSSSTRSSAITSSKPLATRASSAGRTRRWRPGRVSASPSAGRRALWRGDNLAASVVLERALELLPPMRSGVALELDFASAQPTPHRAAAIAEAAAARAREAGDAPGVAAARVVAAFQRMLAGEGGIDEIETDANGRARAARTGWGPRRARARVGRSRIRRRQRTWPLCGVGAGSGAGASPLLGWPVNARVICSASTWRSCSGRRRQTMRCARSTACSRRCRIPRRCCFAPSCSPCSGGSTRRGRARTTRASACASSRPARKEGSTRSRRSRR